MNADSKPADDLVHARDLRRLLNVSRATLLRWRKDRKLPPPDVQATRENVQWRRSTLHAAGFKV